MTTENGDLSFLAHESETMRRVFTALHRAHRLTSVVTDQEALLKGITEESRGVAQAEASSLILWDAQRNDLYFRVALGKSGDQQKLKAEIRLRLGEGIAGAAAQSRRSILVQDAQADPRFFAGADKAVGFRTRNLLAVPMVEREQLVGVLEVVNKVDGEPFSDLDVQVMEMFSSLAAAAVINARLIEEQIRTARLAAIGQAVTGLSHYTKNIVTGLNSSADLIDMGIQREDMEVIARAWPVFRRSTRRITHFVEDMLSFSKPRQPVREWVETEALAEEACATFKDLFTRKHIAMERDLEKAPARVYVDGNAIYRCLLNLLTNAADVVPQDDGRVVLRIGLVENDMLELAVSDNGPGVAESLREQIWDPFFSTKGSRGTGLGLAVTRKITQEHGGTITVEQSSLGGAKFVIRLPLPGGQKSEKEEVPEV